MELYCLHWLVNVVLKPEAVIVSKLILDNYIFGRALVSIQRNKF
jgi:hypothetical protein